MIERGDGARLAFEAAAAVGISGPRAGRIFTATSRPSRVSFAR